MTPRQIRHALLLASALTFASTISGHAQQPAKPKAAPAAQPAPTPSADKSAASPPQPGWAARCGSASRDAPLECAIEQTAVLQSTGQLVVLVNIRVPSDTRVPVATIQLPLGLNLPGGAKLQVDEGKLIDLPIQTCEARGCFASAPVAAETLAAMKAGKQLKVNFQNLAKEAISIPLPLTDFAAAYDKIK